MVPLQSVATPRDDFGRNEVPLIYRIAVSASHAIHVWYLGSNRLVVMIVPLQSIMIRETDLTKTEHC